jgi:trehalose 6-phosphate phosphatase
MLTNTYRFRRLAVHGVVAAAAVRAPAAGCWEGVPATSVRAADPGPAGSGDDPTPVDGALQEPTSSAAAAYTAARCRTLAPLNMLITLRRRGARPGCVGVSTKMDGMRAEEIVAALRPSLAAALIATDFDGTLAPLVPDPEDSRPVDGVIDVLTALAGLGAQVAVITGRDARTVVRLGGLDAVPGLVVAGLYGAETWVGGRLTSPDTPPAVERLRAELPAIVGAGGDPDVWIEDKRLSLVVHARKAADPAAALARLVEPVAALAGELGLEMHRGADVLELRLPGFDKAGALARLAADRRAVLFLGDDLGDLPAFAQIRRLRAAGTLAYCVGVRSSGVAELAGAADVEVADPGAAVNLLRDLAQGGAG